MPTERGQYRFTVKEGAEGQPFIALEPMGETIDAFDQLGARLALDLRPGISLDEAWEISTRLDRWITSVALTYVLPPEISIPSARR
jgi:hypothetical protein